MTANVKLTKPEAPASSLAPPVSLAAVFLGKITFFFLCSSESDPLIAAPTCTGAVSVTHLPDEPTFNASNVQITEAVLETFC